MIGRHAGLAARHNQTEGLTAASGDLVNLVLVAHVIADHQIAQIGAHGELVEPHATVRQVTAQLADAFHEGARGSARQRRVRLFLAHRIAQDFERDAQRHHRIADRVSERKLAEAIGLNEVAGDGRFAAADHTGDAENESHDEPLVDDRKVKRDRLEETGLPVPLENLNVRAILGEVVGDNGGLGAQDRIAGEHQIVTSGHEALKVLDQHFQFGQLALFLLTA